jgi:uncharacterized SAM-binding protein YcdF (DUF218 family)
MTAVDFLKLHLRPSSPLMVIIVLGVATAWLFARPGSRKPRVFLLMVLMGYVLVSTPLGADMLLLGLSHGLQPLTSRDQAPGVDTVVLLGGGAETFSLEDMVVGQLGPSSALRALETARVYKLIHARRVIASGGIPYPKLQLRPEAEMLASALVQAGVPARDIELESESRTTRDEARILRPVILASGNRRFVLVTSAAHMRRALTAFRAVGLDPIPAISPVRSQHLPPVPRLVPNGASLEVSDEAVYDYAAWVYYWLTGWTKE